MVCQIELLAYGTGMRLDGHCSYGQGALERGQVVSRKGKKLG